MMKSAVAITVLLFALVSAPAFAQDKPVDWTLWATAVNTQGSNDLGDGFTVETERGAGFGLSANFFVSPRFSVEAALFSVESEAELFFEPLGTEDDTGWDMGKVELIPVTLGLQYHFVPDSRWDPYLGAGAAWISASDIESDDLDHLGVGALTVDDEFTWFANAGFGFRFGEQIGLALDVRYMAYKPMTVSTVTGTEEDLDLSPIMASLGLKVRF